MRRRSVSLRRILRPRNIRPDGSAEPDEDAVAAKEKILSQSARKAGGPERFCLHHRDRDEGMIA